METHKQHLCLLFQRLLQYRLVINVAKCQFGRETLDFLGHRITQAGTTPLPDKVDAVTCMNQPETVKGLQEFVGMVNFYSRFIPAAAQTMLPLFDTLAGKPKALTWTESMVEAFRNTKKVLADATLLAHPRQGVPTSLTTDASDYAIGAVLQQSVDGVMVPLAFFSKKLRPPERKYSTFDRELLALYLGIRHFHYFLEGRQFTAFTYHKPLTFSMSSLGAMVRSSTTSALLHIRIHHRCPTCARKRQLSSRHIVSSYRYHCRCASGNRLLCHGPSPTAGCRRASLSHCDLQPTT